MADVTSISDSSLAFRVYASRISRLTFSELKRSSSPNRTSLPIYADFTEGGKLKHTRRNPHSTGEIKYWNSHIKHHNKLGFSAVRGRTCCNHLRHALNYIPLGKNENPYTLCISPSKLHRNEASRSNSDRTNSF